MDFPIEVWGIIFPILPLNDITEMSAVCKKFYSKTRKNNFFMKKMSEIRRLYRNERTLYEYYHYSIMCLSFQLSTNLKDYVFGENLLRAREILSRNVYYQILPFRVWNYLFMCEWSQFFVDMCRSCMNGYRNYVKLYALNERISDYITNNFYVETDHFPPEISDGIATAKKVHLFVHTNSVSSNENLFSLNFCGFYYESVSSPYFCSAQFIWIHYPALYLIDVANVFYLCLIRDLVTESIEKLPQPRDSFHIRLKWSFIKKLLFFCNLFNLCVVVEIFENYQRGVDLVIVPFDIDRNE